MHMHTIYAYIPYTPRLYIYTLMPKLVESIHHPLTGREATQRKATPNPWSEELKEGSPGWSWYLLITSLPYFLHSTRHLVKYWETIHENQKDINAWLFSWSRLGRCLPMDPQNKVTPSTNKTNNNWVWQVYCFINYLLTDVCTGARLYLNVTPDLFHSYTKLYPSTTAQSKVIVIQEIWPNYPKSWPKYIPDNYCMGYHKYSSTCCNKNIISGWNVDHTFCHVLI